MKLGLAGVGLMGGALAEIIIEGDHELNIFNRTQSKMTKFRFKGANLYSDSISFIKESNIILLILSDFDAINEVLFSSNFGSFNGKTIVQMSTIAPDESREIAGRVERLGGEYIEAPVLGSIPQIQNRELIILVSGSKEKYDQFLPLFKEFGKKILYLGTIGKAAAMKLALNQLIVSETVAFSMSLGYLRSNNLDVDIFMDILRGSALYAPTFDKKLKMMIDRDFDNPNFPLKHLLKDLDLILGEFGESRINTIALKGIRKILVDSIEKGLSEKDYSALYNSIHPSENES